MTTSACSLADVIANEKGTFGMMLDGYKVILM